MRHPQYRHFGLGNPSFPVVRWIDIYVERYNPQLSRIEPLINIGLLGSKALGHLRDETRQSKLSRIRKNAKTGVCAIGNRAKMEIVRIRKLSKSQSYQTQYSITCLNWRINVISMRILSIELKAIYFTRSILSAINAQVVIK